MNFSSDNSGNESKSKAKKPEVGFYPISKPILSREPNSGSLDDLFEFHDPFSELNLFLAQKIKQEMKHFSNCRKWSIKLQEELVTRITPEFQKKFPRYRLGVTALKKTWEKLNYYIQQIQHVHHEALNQDGKLNLGYLIKENLKAAKHFKQVCQTHPYQFAHQIALKMGECIATVDGTRPQLDQLTRLIWSVHRHLIPELPSESRKSLYDECDQLDKLIVKAIIDISEKQPEIDHKELKEQIKESLECFQDLSSAIPNEKLTLGIAMLLSEKLSSFSNDFFKFNSEEKKALNQFISKELKLCFRSSPKMEYLELVRRILSLLTLAYQLPKELTIEQVHLVIDSFYPNFTQEKPILPQSVFAFFSAQIVMMQHDHYCYSKEHMKSVISDLYQYVQMLPDLKEQPLIGLEMLIWKMLGENEAILEHLPYRLGQKIEQEIFSILIEEPTSHFSAIILKVQQFFQKTKELKLHTKWQEIDYKVQGWSAQSDMLFSWVKLNTESSLFKCILKEKNALKNQALPEYVNTIAQKYLQVYPLLGAYAPQVNRRIWTLLKAAWYTVFNEKNESAFDRFIRWHAKSLSFSKHDPQYLLQQIEEICRKKIPLVPFDSEKIRELLFVEIQDRYAVGNAG